MMPAQPNRSLIDGIDVLLALAGSEAAVGSRELARRLRLEATRTNRLLKTLAAVGIAAQAPDKRYVVGPAIHVLSAMSLFGSGLVRDAMPTLERLGKLGIVIALGVLWRDRVAYLYHCKPGMAPLDAVGRVGLFPATRSSIGLALLAHKSREEIDELYPHSPGTNGTVDLREHGQTRTRKIPGFHTRSALDRELEKVRLRGIATVKHENGESRAVGVWAAGHSPYAAVAISGHIPADRSQEFNETLTAAADAIARDAERREERIER